MKRFAALLAAPLLLAATALEGSAAPALDAPRPLDEAAPLEPSTELPPDDEAHLAIDWDNVTEVVAPPESALALGAGEIEMDGLTDSLTVEIEPPPHPAIAPFRLSARGLRLHRAAAFLLADLLDRYGIDSVQTRYPGPTGVACRDLIASYAISRHRDLTHFGELGPDRAVCVEERADDVVLAARLSGRSIGAFFDSPGPGASARENRPPLRIHGLRPARALLAGAITTGCDATTPTIEDPDCAAARLLLEQIEQAIDQEPVHAP